MGVEENERGRLLEHVLSVPQSTSSMVEEGAEGLKPFL
jgi:hypothetical protein